MAAPCLRCVGAAVLVMMAGTAPAAAQVEAANEDIVVTAQKRSESINNVGMTITAATGDQLKERGITSVMDLPRLVPGFTVQESAFNSTSYTLRGVGFFNSDLATPPAVSIYIDEAPLPYPTMTRLVAFDLERVEVLKGPQGTLYGQNATGGAVNYIAAKPTDELKIGVDAGYGRFNRFDLGGFVSGPLSDTLSARLAVQGSRGSAWQKSTTRPGEKLGKVREIQGRATLLWKPSSDFSSRLSLTITHDGSETLAGQLLTPLPQVPALVNPALLTYPVVLSPRAADWTPGFDYKNDNTLYHLTWRNEWTLPSDITITALTSYARYNTSYAQDFDGTPLLLYNAEANGSHIDTIFQEVRASGDTGRLRWIVGANYDYDKIFDAQRQRYRDYSASHIFDPASTAPFSGEARAGTTVHAYGIYANLDYKLTDTLSLQGGARYTKDKRKFAGCTFDVDFTVAQVVNAFQGAVNGGIPITPIAGGGCITLDPADSFRPVSEVRRTLNEDNLSWRAELNWKATPDTLVYASLSRGYKAGTFPVVGASLINQFNPVTQESVLSYEAGIKATLFDRLLQLNAAGFYYAYTDKQLRGKILDPVFGPLEALVTIPTSHVQGIEAQAILRPVRDLVIDTSLTHVRSKIDRFVGVSSAGVLGDFAGTSFPFSPKWQSVTDVSYKIPLNGDVDLFAGGTLTYNSRTNSGIGSPAILTIDGFTMLDLRGGVETADGKYRLTVWGKNVTNKYHWSSTFLGFDTVTRFVAQPATYGVSLSARF